jgi:hypothetical protein
MGDEAKHPRKLLPASALIGFLQPHYSGPPITEEMIDTACAEAAAERWFRSQRDPDEPLAPPHAMGQGGAP